MRKEIKRAKPYEGNSGYITTNRELKDFTKQVESQQFGDKQFEKAYKEFRTPPYCMNKPKQDKKDGGICQK